MKSTLELEAEIVRLHYAEHWPVGTIAKQLEAHPDQVRRVLGLGEGRAPSQLRGRLVDPYRPFIDETLARYPKLLATRLYDMLRERGYPGSARTLREFVATVRPRPRREAYLVTETLPGEQRQIDWAYVGKLPVPGGERALWLFVMVLGQAIRLLDLYGDHVFAAAAADIDARGLADVGALAVACEQRRKDRKRPVPIELILPEHLDDADVIPHDLESYDE